MEEIWTTKEGEEIPIKDLKDGHLMNILAMLGRKGFIPVSLLHFYLTTSGPNGDAARDAFNAECDEIFSRPVSKHLDALRAEAKRRGLQPEEID